MPCFYVTSNKDDYNQIPSRVSRMTAHGRLLPVTIGIPSTLDRLLLGESGHSEKRHHSTDA